MLSRLKVGKFKRLLGNFVEETEKKESEFESDFEEDFVDDFKSSTPFID